MRERSLALGPRKKLPQLLSLALLFSCSCSKHRPTNDTSRPDAFVTAVASVEKPAPAAPRPSANEASPKRTYNVLLVMIDSLRADMPWAGYPRPIAPWLTAFAKQSTLYPRAYSLSSYTAKSVAPALVGKYPSEMERDGYFFTKWLPQNLFVSERARELGHRSLAGHAHGYFLRGLGLDQGFDDYRLLPGTFLDVTGVANVTSEALNGLAKRQLSDPANVALPENKRFFAYFHFLDPHYTYFKHKGHPDFGDERRDLYDNEVHYSDYWVGNLVDWARGQPWGKDTAVIITADHGEGFGEHGQYRHAYELWESLVRVPMFIQIPGAKPREIAASRSHIDLAPTIAELLGLPSAPPFRGKSLVGEVLGEAVQERPVIADLPRCDLMDRRRALISGAYKLLAFGDDNSFKLYDVLKDFKERNELSKSEPAKLDEMKTLYSKLSSSIDNVPVTGSVPLLGAPKHRRW